jgi:hypothetical protein
MSRLEPPAEHNPALANLAPLVGDWTMELSHAAFLPKPTDTVRSVATFAWIEGGALLALYQGDKPPQTPAARWIIGRDQDGDDDRYTVLYSDTRGVSRLYAMRFALPFGGGSWELRRDSPTFSQRFTARVSDDLNTITGSWRKRVGDGEWEHDFDVTYQRSAPS